MKFTTEQDAAIAALYNAMAVSLNALVLQHSATLTALDIHLFRIELTLHVEPHNEKSPAETDADFLRSLRIAPELTPTDRTQ